MSQKNIKINFYTSGQDNKQPVILNKLAFEHAWSSTFSQNINAIMQFDRGISVNTTKKLKFKIFNYNSTTKTYFGYIGTERDALLPSIFNTTLGTESDISLNVDDEVVEKCFFMYYEEHDILSFNQNHIGPRVDDLNYVLGQIKGPSEDFEPIWRTNALQTLLTGNAIIKSAEITIAVPRNFCFANLNLSTTWSNDILDMMDKNGMSRLKLSFSSRASTKKSGLSYLSSTIKEGIAELVSVFGNIGTSASSPRLEKADVLPAGKQKSSLLDKEISSTQTVKVIKGYPTLADIQTALVMAFNQNVNDLRAYFMTNRS